ncbi:hypothetical protein QEN19_000443 [Hanseniaspora menglaensis]
MTDENDESKFNLKVCRICQEDEVESEAKLIKPCKCNSHIHKKCLLRWIKTKLNSDVIDYQNDLKCEICLSKIKYTNARSNEATGNMNSSYNSDATNLSNIFKILLKKNKNGLKSFFTCLIFLIIPSVLMISLTFIFYRLLSINAFIPFSLETFEKQLQHEDTNWIYVYWIKIGMCLNAKLFPPTYKKLIKNLVLLVISTMTAAVPLFEDARNGFDLSTLHKMYEYQFGREKAIEEYEKLKRKILSLNNQSFLQQAINYFKFLTTFVSLAFMHALLQEAIPRFIYQQIIGEHSDRYSHFFSIYYNLFGLLFAYSYLTYKHSTSKIGGFGVLVVFKIKPELFPLVFELGGMKFFFLERIILSLISAKVMVLKSLIYSPLCQRLGAVFRLSNYLFDYDRPLERGTFVYRQSINPNNFEMCAQARNSNPTLYENPCFSKREALYFLNNADSSINAYLIQDGCSIKVPNASTVPFFQKGLMKPVDNLGNVIIKEEELDEDELLFSENSTEQDNKKNDEDMFAYSFNQNNGFDVCFVPSNFKIRLFGYFTTIAVIQNTIVFFLILVGYHVGSFLFNIKAVSWLYELAFTVFSKEAEEFPEEQFLNPNDPYVLPKIIIGAFIFVFGVAIVTKKTDSLSITWIFMKNYITETVFSFVIMFLLFFHVFIFSAITSFSLTYLQTMFIMLFNNLFYDSGMYEQISKIGIYETAWFFDNFTILYFTIIGFLNLSYNVHVFVTLLNKRYENAAYTFKNVIQDVFKKILFKQYKFWIKFFVVPFVFQHFVLVFVCLKSIHLPNDSLLQPSNNDHVSFSERAYLSNILLVISGKKMPSAIVYKAIYVGYVMFLFLSYSSKIIIQKWNSLKTLTRDNINEENEVIILEDES